MNKLLILTMILFSSNAYADSLVLTKEHSLVSNTNTQYLRLNKDIDFASVDFQYRNSYFGNSKEIGLSTFNKDYGFFYGVGLGNDSSLSNFKYIIVGKSKNISKINISLAIKNIKYDNYSNQNLIISTISYPLNNKTELNFGLTKSNGLIKDKTVSIGIKYEN